jgi:uroporphyrinogen decarboxylase
MFSQPDAWHRLMDKLTNVVADYLMAQVRAGAQVLQVFDSWAGVLAPDDFREYVLPYVQRVITQATGTGVPVIYFGTDLNGMLPILRETGADVIGVDWRIPIDEAWEQLGAGVAIQGNLDPVALFAPWPEVQRRVDDVLRRVGDRPGYIFNLGHGILPQTPVDNVRRLVDYVHECSREIKGL